MNNGILEICDQNENVLMSIAESLQGNSMLIQVSGEIRNQVAHEFEDEIMAAFSVCPNIRIDLKETTYIASFALRALLAMQQIVDATEYASMVICNLSKPVREVFEQTGFVDILCVEER